MAALIKVSGRRVETIIQEIPDPPPVPQPTTPPTIPPPAVPPARDPWNYMGGFFYGGQFIVGKTLYKKTIFVGDSKYEGLFSNGKQIGAWDSDALVKLYPDWHYMARTVIPEWDYFNW